MSHEFDRDFWQRHWQGAADGSGGSGAESCAGDRGDDGDGDGGGSPNPYPNPYLARETAGLAPGTALDAGCGAGAEAIWLASRGWHVTAADISAAALARAAARAKTHPELAGAGSLQWIEADLTVWRPASQFDLVMTHYAHPATGQPAFYDRIGEWVAPGGTLLIVGHVHGAGHGHDHRPPAEASATSAAITARMDSAEWQIVTAEQCARELKSHDGRAVTLHDVVVRAVRRRWAPPPPPPPSCWSRESV